MRILILSDINSAHTRKWVTSLASKGIETGVFSFSPAKADWDTGHENISVFTGKPWLFSKSLFGKFSYLAMLPGLKKVIREFRPDILHAHYASSYGFLGRLTGFHPYFISCWGSDVMEFPGKGIIRREVLTSTLSSADRIFATSRTLVNHIHRFSSKNVDVVPFGVDTEEFKPIVCKKIFEEGSLVVGTIKSLEKVYCIDVLIEAFCLLRKENLPVKLLIAGDGSRKEELLSLVKKNKIENDVLFTGRISYKDVPYYHNLIDIFVNISERESFGVSVIEAMSCAKAVVASRTGGLTEIVSEGEDGLLVSPHSVSETADAIRKLVLDEQLRRRLGENARRKIQKEFNWKILSENIIHYYGESPAKK